MALLIKKKNLKAVLELVQLAAMPFPYPERQLENMGSTNPDIEGPR